MDRMINKLQGLLFLIGALLMLESCGQVVRTEIQKGLFLKEEATGRTVELERIPRIELQSPVTARVFEEVRSGQEYENKYEKVVIEEKVYGGKKAVQERSVVRNEYVVEKIYKNLTTAQQNIASGLVSVKVNDVQREDFPIGQNGTATVALERYFDTYPEGKDIKVEFHYKTATATSAVSFEEAKKNAIAMLPAYRTRSAKDLIIAYKIGNDMADLVEARRFASTEEDKKEIERLFEGYLDLSRFDQARRSHTLADFIKAYPNSKYLAEAMREEQAYTKYIKKNCRGVVMTAEEFARHSNYVADKGKCVSVFIVKKTPAPLKSGLFKMEGKVYYFEFPVAQKSVVVSGLARIIGDHGYTTPTGAFNIVPHLRHLPDSPAMDVHY